MNKSRRGRDRAYPKYYRGIPTERERSLVEARQAWLNRAVVEADALTEEEEKEEEEV